MPPHSEDPTDVATGTPKQVEHVDAVGEEPAHLGIGIQG